MVFEVIPNEHTPLTPEIDDVGVFIDEKLEIIEAFKEYAKHLPNTIGLAANQCGLDGERLNLRMVGVKDFISRIWTIAIDPKITNYYGEEKECLEGCLTWKGRKIIAKRSMLVDVEFYTPDGEFHQKTFSGFQAQVWQHELNHINGIEETKI